MKTFILAMGILCAVFSGAEAKRYTPKTTASECFIFMPCQEKSVVQRAYGVRSPELSVGHGVGPRPRAWCGWFMQTDTGITSRGTGLNLNLARAWAGVGSRSEARIGAIVVWRHHVGRIVGGSPGAWVVRSGNDGRAVRERVRSVSNAIAFRAI